MSVSDATTVGGGDWTCSDIDCHHVNYARRTQCHKCNRERSLDRSSSSGGSSSAKKKLGTEIGKAAAEKSRGLFSAEDWQCSKCANVNWARRQTCNMCNAPKFCDVEERTGYGGGYNDRGVVEYKERSESDSEYDEFGRLKKRKIKDAPPKEIPSKKPREGGIESDDEDDDDEEGDNGDLSKYDLWGDDDDIPAKENKLQSQQKDVIKKASSKSNKRNSRSSRSSSSSSSSTSSTSSSSSSSSSRSRSSSSARSRSCSRQRSYSKERNSRSNNHKSSRNSTHNKSRSRSKSQTSTRSSTSSSKKKGGHQSRYSNSSRSPNSHYRKRSSSPSLTGSRRRR